MTAAPASAYQWHPPPITDQPIRVAASYFPFPAPFAFAARTAAHRFFVAAMIAFRPAALSLRLGFGGAALAVFNAAHRFLCAAAIRLRADALSVLLFGVGALPVCRSLRPPRTAMTELDLNFCDCRLYLGLLTFVSDQRSLKKAFIVSCHVVNSLRRMLSVTFVVLTECASILSLRLHFPKQWRPIQAEAQPRLRCNVEFLLLTRW